MVNPFTGIELEKGFATLDGQSQTQPSSKSTPHTPWWYGFKLSHFTWPLRILGSPGVSILFLLAGTFFINWIQANLNDRLYDPNVKGYNEAINLATQASWLGAAGLWHAFLAMIYAGVHPATFVGCVLFGWFVPTSYCGFSSVKA